MPQSDSRPFWLGLIGGLLGIAAAFFAFFVGAFASAFDPSAGYDSIMGLGASALLFSITGIVGGVLKKNTLGAALMIISGILVLISVSLFGVPAFIFFLIGGLIKYKNQD
ncbi:MAG: hypothetical protein PWP08_814 [Methanofollis sp.]|nr:hypothetical protein [Methanofollis sp.]